MLFNPIIDRFTQAAPVATMVRVAMANVLSSRELDAIFHDCRERQYQGKLLFSSLVRLMSLVVSKSKPSLHAAYQSQQEELGVSAKALYDKARHVELSVTRELVARTAEKMGDVIDQLTPPQPTLEGYRTYVLDGSHLAATQHRLKETRASRGGPLPGHGLVVLDADRRLIVDFLPTTDGHEQERNLLPAWTDWLQPGQLWIADRNFCVKLVAFECQLNDCFFLMREHGRLKPTPLGESRPAGRCATGNVSEQEVQIAGEREQQALTARRITIDLDEATAEGERQIVLLTNLPQDVATPTVADLYRERWSVERAFGELTLSLRGEIDTLAYPEAALFGYAIALVLYNLLAVVKAAMASVHGQEKVREEVSVYYLAEEAGSVMHGLDIAVPTEEWSRRYADLPPRALADELLKMAKHTQLRRYKKHKRGPKKPAPARRRDSPHLSTARLLATRRQR
jgi:IS4 transposase